MFVLELTNVAGSQKCVDHEAQKPVHLWRHAAVHGLDVKARIGLVPYIDMVSQGFGLAQDGGVFGDRESTARFLRDLHFGEHWHLDQIFFHQIAQHFAQLCDVAHDGRCRQFFVRQKVDELLNTGSVDEA